MISSDSRYLLLIVCNLPGITQILTSGIMYINTTENPADFAFRGLDVNKKNRQKDGFKVLHFYGRIKILGL